MKKTAGGTTTQFLYDGLNPVQELNSSNVATANLLTGLNIDEFFSRTDSSGARSFLTDILGSTLALTDSSGTFQTQYTYEPFGNVTVSGPANGNSYQFTGRENDSAGLYFFRARYYSPTFQRFVSQDPIGFASGDASLYAYVLDRPTDFTDPFGTQEIFVDPPAEEGGSWLEPPAEEPEESAAPDEPSEPDECDKEHTKNKRPSTECKHERCQRRKQMDKLRREKGDKRRPYRQRGLWWWVGGNGGDGMI